MKLTKEKVNGFDYNSALYVVAHGLWQKSRKRSPSVPYHAWNRRIHAYETILNPRKAFQVALSEVESPESLVGTLVNDHITMMVTCANLLQKPVRSDFNDIELVATQNDVVGGILAYFHKEQALRAKKYANSPAGIAIAILRNQEIASMKESANQLMQQLEVIDFDDFPALLDWMCAMQNSGDDIDVELNAIKILEVFERHGYIPNMNCANAFDENDPENYLGYIVGQVLHCIASRGHINQIVHHFAKLWREKFESVTDQDGEVIH